MGQECRNGTWNLAYSALGMAMTSGMDRSLLGRFFAVPMGPGRAMLLVFGAPTCGLWAVPAVPPSPGHVVWPPRLCSCLRKGPGALALGKKARRTPYPTHAHTLDRIGPSGSRQGNPSAALPRACFGPRGSPTRGPAQGLPKMSRQVPAKPPL